VCSGAGVGEERSALGRARCTRSPSVPGMFEGEGEAALPHQW